jgi:hypothetical protein
MNGRRVPRTAVSRSRDAFGGGSVRSAVPGQSGGCWRFNLASSPGRARLRQLAIPFTAGHNPRTDWGCPRCVGSFHRAHSAAGRPSGLALPASLFVGIVMAFLRNDAVNRVNLHSGIQALAHGAGAIFFLVFLLRAGISVPAALVAQGRRRDARDRVGRRGCRRPAALSRPSRRPRRTCPAGRVVRPRRGVALDSPARHAESSGGGCSGRSPTRSRRR